MAEVILGSRGGFVASQAALARWCEADLVFVEIMLDLCWVCLASKEVVIGWKESYIYLNRNLLPSNRQKGSGYGDIPVLVHK